MKFINKLQKSSSRYYNFLGKTVKGFLSCEMPEMW